MSNFKCCNFIQIQQCKIVFLVLFRNNTILLQKRKILTNHDRFALSLRVITKTFS
jgi:hypothetical protein